MVKPIMNHIFICLFLISVVPLNCEPNHQESWKNLWSISDSAVRKLGNYLDNQLTPLIKSESISISCQKSLLKVINGIKNFDINSVKMFDSWGKLPSGLLFGTWTDLGSLDQCVSLDNSQYCLLTASMPVPAKRQHEGLFIKLDKSSFNLTDPLSTYLYPYAHHFHNVNLTFGVCAPRQCSPREMTSITKSLIHSHGLQMKVNVDLCQNRDKSGNEILFREYISMIIISIVIGLNIFGTIYPNHPIIGHFNFPLNWSKVLSTNNQTNRSYPYLECFKFFGMLYIIITHVGWAFNHNSFHSTFKIHSVYKSFLGYSLLPSYMGSEVYFLMIGLELMTFFLAFKGKFPFSSAISFLLIRWARFVTLIGFYISLYIIAFSNHVRDLIGGPFWSHLLSATSIPGTCGERWYRHVLLYSHLLSNPDNWNLCMMPDWFLQVDFALAFLFLLVLWPLRMSHRRLSLTLTLLLIFSGPVILGLVIYYKSASPTWLPYNYINQRLAIYLVYVHSQPYTHMSPYFVGVLLAFILQSKDPIIKKTIHIRLMWLLWLAFNLIIYGYEYYINYNIGTMSPTFDIIYASFSRILLSFVFSWPIYCLHYKFVPDFLYRFTCSGFFKPMARINLTVLFMNEIIIRLRNATQNYINDPTIFNASFNIIAPTIMLTYSFSLIVSPMIDGPSISLLKSYLKTDGKYDEYLKKQTVNLNNNLISSTELKNESFKKDR